MQRCTKCGEKFNYLGVSFSLCHFHGYEPIECENCKANYKITILSRIVIGLLVGGDLLIFNRYLFGVLDNALIWYTLCRCDYFYESFKCKI